MHTLTLQAYLPPANTTKISHPSEQAQWQDVAKLEFNDDKQLMALTYLHDHSQQHFLMANLFAVSVRYPVELFSYHADKGWFTFLDDIIPAGASRRYWLKRLNLSRHSLAEQNYELLKHATIAPVGHLRIKEAVQATPNNKINDDQRLFTLTDVINRDVNFLEYANEQGAMAGGATGAGGEAPKLLLRQKRLNQNTPNQEKHNQTEPCKDALHSKETHCNTPEHQDTENSNTKHSINNHSIWIDHLQDDTVNGNDHYYLVKYPRGKRSQIDCDILRAEYYFYHELSEMGFDTINTTHMQLHEGIRYPSLWLPRFDIYKPDNTAHTNQTKRYAMESVYSMLKKEAGAYLNHNDCIRELLAIINSAILDTPAHTNTDALSATSFDKTGFVIDWVQRDLLNLAFGNSDNHGRNIAFIRDEYSIKLAPIFDFAPMKADPEGIVRSIKWDRELESGGQLRFDLIAEQLADLVPPAILLDELKQTAKQLLDLPVRLADKGTPTSILTFPSIGFERLPDKLADWRIL